jgi:hypothetical protein
LEVASTGATRGRGVFRNAVIWTTYAVIQTLVLISVVVLVFLGSAAPRSELLGILGGLLLLLGIHIGVFRIEIRALWVTRLGIPVNSPGVPLAIAIVLGIVGALFVIAGLSINLNSQP